MEKVFISPSQQAHNPYWGGLGVESVHCRKIGQATVDELRRNGIICKMASDYSNLSTGYVNAATESQAFNSTLHICIHSNAGAHGTRGFYISDKGKRLTQNIVSLLQPLSPGTPDTVSLVPAHWYEVYNVSAPVAYIEVEDHSWDVGAKWIVANEVKIGKTIAYGIMAYLGVTPKPDVVPTPAPTPTPTPTPPPPRPASFVLIRAGVISVSPLYKRMVPYWKKQVDSYLHRWISEGR